MKEYEVISNYRKSKKGDAEALEKLMTWYINVQYFILPADWYNCHGLTGHGSVFYTADECKSTYNYEYNEALLYIADKILEFGI